MSGAYYNELDPRAAAWLRELIRAGHIAPGEVDERSIEDITPYEIARYAQCHFFAGIGVWSYALRTAGWADSRSVWTGSCPCQPLSQAGKGLGFADERHLWPAWEHLIRECRPPVIFGEQVASKAANNWTDLVQDDLEALDYSFGAVPFPAASVGAPHIRDRLYWVAYDDAGRIEHAQRHSQPEAGFEAGQSGRDSGGRGELGDCVAHSSSTGLEVIGEQQTRGQRQAVERSGPAHPWDPCEFVWCRDQRWRPVEPGSFPLAHGAPARVGRLRGYGNAIVATQAQVFIEASGLV